MNTANGKPQTSALNGLDPRALVLAATGAAFCFSFVQSLALACACLVFSLVLALLGRPRWKPLLRSLALANFFVLFIWLTVPWTMPGETILKLGPLGFSREGLELAALVSIKCNAILLSFLVLTGHLGPSVIGAALERLRAPSKLVFLFLFMCRHIHVIGEEWRKLQTAAALRGFVPRSSLHTYRTIAGMLGLTFINSIDRSHRIYEAMLLRAFNGEFHTVAELRARPADFVFSAVFFSILAGLLCADIWRISG